MASSVAAITVTPAQVELARQQKDAAVREYRRQWRHRVVIQTQRVLEVLFLVTLRFISWARPVLDASLMRVGGLLVAATAGAGIVIIAISFRQTHLQFGALIVPLGAVLATVAYLPVAFVPHDEGLARLIVAWTSEVAVSESRCKTARARLSELYAKMQSAKDRYVRLRSLIESQLHRLLTCNWESMQGYDFEGFLRSVFQERGYSVRMTGQTGDQGVDLIVERDGVSIAIQAKGYPSLNSVGNEAVQQANTGSQFYRCHRAAVVTNSHFTQAARTLAESVECVLIDRSQIRDLILGRITL